MMSPHIISQNLRVGASKFFIFGQKWCSEKCRPGIKNLSKSELLNQKGSNTAKTDSKNIPLMIHDGWVYYWNHFKLYLSHFG